MAQPALWELALRQVMQPLAEWSSAGIRTTDVDQLRRAYRMSPRRFDWLNSRSEWFIWHLVPEVIRGRLPDRPLHVVDLGCGNGSSTVVLARFLPDGSRFLAIDLVPVLVEQARARRARGAFTTASGARVWPDFAVGSVGDTWRGERGDVVPDGSVDFITSFGLVGHHLDAALLGALVREADRVLASDGLLALDPGPRLPAAAIARVLQAGGFHHTATVRGHVFDPYGQVLFRREAARPAQG